MTNDQLIEKLDAWVQSHPESADTPYMNMSTEEAYTVRGLLKELRASAAGEAQLSESHQAELNKIESWIGGL